MKTKLTAYLLWFFLGTFSAHRFYLGKTGSAILYLLTFQLLGVGWLIDLFLLGGMVDKYNIEHGLIEKTTIIKESNLGTEKILKGVFSAIILIVGFWYLFGGGLEQQAQKDLDKIENQVAEDAVKQYEIAKRNGSDMDAYVQARMVCAAYLQANDEVNYKKWKAIEKEAARKVGL